MEKWNGGRAKASGVSCFGCFVVQSMQEEMETGAGETNNADLDKTPRCTNPVHARRSDAHLAGAFGRNEICGRDSHSSSIQGETGATVGSSRNSGHLEIARSGGPKGQGARNGSSPGERQQPTRRIDVAMSRGRRWEARQQLEGTWLKGEKQVAVRAQSQSGM